MELSDLKTAWLKFGPLDTDGYTQVIDAKIKPAAPPAEPSKYPLYGQRQDPWDLDLLGNSRVSRIHDYGCAVTCMAMMAGTDPRTMNVALRNAGNFRAEPKGGYLASFDILKATQQLGTNARPIKLLKVSPQHQDAFPWVLIFELFDHLKAGKPAIIEVDSNLVTVDLNQHFVLATGTNGTDDVTINDPWFYETASITKHYGATLPKAIWRTFLYDFA